MKFFNSILFVFIFSVVLYSCNKIPNHIKYVPKNALGVFSVDMNKFSKKLIWNMLTDSKLFEDMQKDIKNEDSKKAMKDVSNIGLDAMSTMYAFYVGDLKEENNLCIAVAMKDASKFESFLSKNYPQIAIDKNDLFQSCVIEERILVSWNKEVMLVMPMTAQYDFSKEDTVVASYNVDEFKAYLKSMYLLDTKNSIKELKHFVDLQKADHDFTVWLNYEEIYKQSNSMADATVKMFLKDGYFKDAALATGFDFEKGKIDMDMDYFFSKELAAIYKKSINNTMDVSLINSLPSENIDLLVSYNLKPQMIQDFLKEFNLDGIINLGLAAVGLNMENLLSIFKGDIVFAVTDLRGLDSVASMTQYTPDLNMYYAMTIQDQSKLEQLLAKGTEQSVLKKNGSVYTLPGVDQGGLTFDKNRLVYSNKLDKATQYLNNKGNDKNKSIPSEVYSKLSANPISVYANMNKILDAVPSNSMDTGEKEILQEVKKLCTYGIIYGGKMKGDANHFEGNLFFTNQDENAMIQLLNLGMKIKKTQDDKSKSTPQIDTLNV